MLSICKTSEVNLMVFLVSHTWNININADSPVAIY